MIDCTIVIASYNRRDVLDRTLAVLTGLPERPAIVVVDDGSSDGSSAMVRRRWAAVRLVELQQNCGAAAARNAGAAFATTRYVAFCDDDCAWRAGALACAVRLLDAHPEVALLNARVVVGDDEHLDAACALMACSALPKRTGCPGRAIAAFMAGASVVRRDAFLAAGGYEARYHIGAEESLLALDLLARGWELLYLDDMVVHHRPHAAGRVPDRRRRIVMRNRLWTAWLRRSARGALRATMSLARQGLSDPIARSALRDAVRGLGMDRARTAAHLVRGRSAARRADGAARVVLRAFAAEPTVDAGGTLTLHVATDAPRFRVVLERWSDAREVVAHAGPFAGQDAPPGACDAPWDWPRFALPLSPHLRAGAYVARFAADGGAPARGAPHEGSPDARWGTALFVVRAPSRARILVNLPLFTYHAYDVAHVDGTRGAGEGECLYSGARCVTLRRPGGGTGGHPWDEVNPDVYDRSSPRQTFAHWDRHALAWFARNDMEVDVCTDLDLHRGTVDLARYALLCTFGHDEYWTRAKRARVERWLDGGGNAAFFGGNTCWFRVRFDEARCAIARDGSWSDDEPEDALTGLSYRRGGGKWIGPRPPSAYRIECAAHPLLRGTGLRDGDRVGGGTRLIGYECDGVDPTHAPAGLTVLARASLDRWDVRDGSGAVPPGGHAAMATFRRGAGTVFNAGTTDWARALALRDPRVHALTTAVVTALSAPPARSHPAPHLLEA